MALLEQVRPGRSCGTHLPAAARYVPFVHVAQAPAPLHDEHDESWDGDRMQHRVMHVLLAQAAFDGQTAPAACCLRHPPVDTSTKYPARHTLQRPCASHEIQFWTTLDEQQVDKRQVPDVQFAPTVHALPSAAFGTQLADSASLLKPTAHPTHAPPRELHAEQAIASTEAAQHLAERHAPD
jgi:hypothetical protein